MLYVSKNISNYKTFHKMFEEMFHIQCIDLSKVSTNLLVSEVESILNHHKECCVFLGYLEPGWMLDPTHQTRIRKLFRKFNVGLVVNFVESLPFSWKNEIHTLYI